MSKVVATVVSLLKDTASDVRRSAAKAVKRFGKICPGFGGRMVEVRALLLSSLIAWVVCSVRDLLCGCHDSLSRT